MTHHLPLLLLLVFGMAACAGRGRPAEPTFRLAPTTQQEDAILGWGEGESRDLGAAVRRATMLARTPVTRAAEAQIGVLLDRFLAESEATMSPALVAQLDAVRRAAAHRAGRLSQPRAQEVAAAETGRGVSVYRATVHVGTHLRAVHISVVDSVRAMDLVYKQLRASPSFQDLETALASSGRW